MGGEFCREAGVLMIVLAPMEQLVTNGRLTALQALGILVLAGSSLACGFWLGLERE